MYPPPCLQVTSEFRSKNLPESNFNIPLKLSLLCQKSATTNCPPYFPSPSSPLPQTGQPKLQAQQVHPSRSLRFHNPPALLSEALATSSFD
mmetsp:Transcript_15931/g.34497  ORF Transcript_15931/g.34497 Transcript_15931/m.34497 type:complete len:91 (-) Transcript_15931:889-1161(-)